MQVLCRWKIWLLSTSAVLNIGTYLSPPQAEVIAFRCSPPRCRFSRTQFCKKPFLPSLIYLHLAFHAYFSFFNLFSPHTHLTFRTPCRCPVLLVEQPIQQVNKAAYSITQRIIKHSQKAAALWFTPTAVRNREMLGGEGHRAGPAR